MADDEDAEFHIIIRLKVAEESLRDLYSSTDDGLGDIESAARDYFKNICNDQLSGENFQIEEEFEMGFSGPVNPRKRA